MGFILNALKKRFEEQAAASNVLPGTVMMISGCEDHQTSADVSNLASFQLPDPAGRAGGACTATLLKVCYADEHRREDNLSFTEVLMEMRDHLQSQGYEQIPQLTSSKPIDVNATFDLVPPEATGTRRALLIGINYIGHESGVLSGCHNDVLNMVKYIK
jgi:metacaspase-1